MARRKKNRVVLAAGLRLPQARAGGAYAREDAAHLGASLTRELLARTGIPRDAFDEVIAGCVGPPHDQANVARVIAMRAGIPQEVPAQTVARNCASGMQAVATAATMIEAGRGELFLCLGVEVMSAYPLLFNRAAVGFFSKLSRARSLGQRLAAMSGFRPKMLAPRVALVEGLTDPTCGLIMGSTAEHLARDFGISREASDAYALESHRRASRAVESGRLAAELVAHLPLGAGSSSKPARALESDDGIRKDQTMHALQKLKPYFEKPDGVVTVGNACGITDGATALVVTTESRAKELGLRPLAALRGRAWAGLDPSRMGLGPVHASAAALDEAECSLADMQTVELNEAFAVQVLACARAFEDEAWCQRTLGRGALGALDPERLNPNGGAIAVGHPVGATGARLLLTLAHELEARDQELGLATLCIGGGQGGAMVLERVSA